MVHRDLKPSNVLLAPDNPDAAVVGDRVYFDGGDGRLHAGRISPTEK
ncbi:hypothetical protein ACIO87_30085 [Streptomyces sp. NPDC087218]